MLSDTITGPSCVVPPPPPSGSGQVYVAPVYPLINVTKIPSPLNLPGGPGSVTYTYTVTNIGPNVIGDVTVKDDQCSSVNFIDGDDNGDSNLDLNESWKYECTKTVNATETNTVTACGTASNAVSTGVACDTASATVTVGIPVIPPLIHIIKKPNIFLLPAGGGAVTYSYTVTNPGTVPLHDVSVTDNKCTGLPGRVVGHPGDLNNNNLLESNESWSFTCLSNIFQTTTNIATAEGNANGFTVIDYAQATVAVAAPKLPNTGIAPSDVAIIIVGLLMLIGVFYYLARKKQTA
jgi:LPXTG-motif cell wall-anchored protein